MGLMEEILANVNAKSGSFAKIFGLKDNEEATVRFLTAANDGITLVVHTRWVQGDMKAGYTVPCPLQYGKETCPYCGNDKILKRDKSDPKKILDSTNTAEMYGWIIYNLTNGMSQLFIYKSTKATPLGQLAYQVGKLGGNIFGRNFNIRRKGTNTETEHFVDKEDPSDIIIPQAIQREIPKTKAGQHELMKKWFAEAFAPEVLAEGEVVHRMLQKPQQANAKTKEAVIGMLNGSKKEEEEIEELTELEEIDIDLIPEGL